MSRSRRGRADKVVVSVNRIRATPSFREAERMYRDLRDGVGAGLDPEEAFQRMTRRTAATGRSVPVLEGQLDLLAEVEE